MASSLLEKYDMSYNKRGKCVIINIQKYVNDLQKERIWSQIDVTNVKTTFEKLDFDVDLYQNLNSIQINNLITTMSLLDHSDADCFACVLMAHGYEDTIIASDNEEVSIDDILNPIKECKSLNHKPKLFFVQACRGDNEIQRPKQIINYNNSVTDSLPSSSQKDKPRKKQLIAESDVLVFNSTLPGHKSWGRITTGTIFISKLCKVLDECAKKYPVSQMIPMINRLVKDDNGMELADPVLRLHKELYFKKVYR